MLMIWAHLALIKKDPTLMKEELEEEWSGWMITIVVRGFSKKNIWLV